MELNKTYTGGDNDNGTKSFQEMCLLMSAYSVWYSGIWDELKNSTILGADNYPKTPTAAYYIFLRYKKPKKNAKHTHYPGRWFFSRVKIQTTARQSQENMEDRL